MIPDREEGSIGRPHLSLRPDLLKSVLQLQKRGWEIALQTGNVNADQSERIIAGYLFIGMIEAKQELELPIIVADAVGTRSANLPPDPDGEADIVIWFYGDFDDHEPHVVIECKRVNEEGSRLQREYVNEGMERFIVGKYGPGHEWHFMVGFVIQGTVSVIVGRINNYLSSKGDETSSLNSDDAYSSFENVFRSTHIQTSHNISIKILHSFLSFFN